jgi:hypothetical protein
VTLLSGPGAAADAQVEGTAGPSSQPLALVVTSAVLRSGWLPLAVLSAATVAALLAYQVPAADITRYAAYTLLAVSLPGTLLWRLLRGSRVRVATPWVEDVAGGTALGWAIELPVYLLARAADAPLAVVAWPALTVLCFAVVPRLRRYWRPKDTITAPLGWSWSMAGVGLLVLLGAVVQYYRWHGLSGKWASQPYFDVVYQLALAAEVKHHVPPTTPYVLGTPLDYHWFVHGHMAAASWISGVELQTIVYRLFGLPMLAAFTVLISLTAWRLTGRWWPGALAAAATFALGALSPYGWAPGAYFDLSLLYQNLWVSPTQTFAATLFAALVLPLIDRLRGEAGGRGQWVAVVLLTGAVMGAKATYLPMLLAGLGLVVAVRLVLRPRSRTAVLAGLAAGAVTAAYFVFATLVVFGGQSHALVLAPLDSLRWWAAAVGTGLNAGFHGKPWWLPAALLVFTAVSWLVPAAGAGALLARWRRLVDPAVLILLGVIGSGAVLTLMLKHPGVSQLYFWRSASPYLLVLAIAGLAAVLPAAPTAPTAQPPAQPTAPPPAQVTAQLPTQRLRVTLPVVLGAVLAGAALAWLAALAAGGTAPHGRPRSIVLGLGAPLVIVLIGLAIGTVALLVARRRVAALRGLTVAVLVAAALGTGLPPTVAKLSGIVRAELAARHVVYSVGAGARPIAPGGIEAARWLRDHSGPDDVVATNTHCRAVANGRCDNRHFWVSAFTERRVLVEGWGYTPKVYERAWQSEFATQRFWDPRLLAENDRAFTDPTPASIGLLRDRYRVRWLFVDERYDRPAPTLDQVATLRYRADGVAVYSI